MIDDIPARIDRNRNKLAELRDANVTGKDLYAGLTFVIGDLYHVQEYTRTAERLAKIEVLEDMLRMMDKLRFFSICDYKEAKSRIETMLSELKEASR